MNKVQNLINALEIVKGFEFELGHTEYEIVIKMRSFDAERLSRDDKIKLENLKFYFDYETSNYFTTQYNKNN